MAEMVESNSKRVKINEVCLVTGGTGLYGKAIEHVTKIDGAPEVFYFASSKDGDLRDMAQTKVLLYPFS